VSLKCVQCHGASLIASEREDARKWDRITRQMQRYSQRFPGIQPITDQERSLAALYLARTLAEPDDNQDSEAGDEPENDGDDRDSRGRRRRGRDR
jgi:hypothetical protein